EKIDETTRARVDTICSSSTFSTSSGRFIASGRSYIYNRAGGGAPPTSSASTSNWGILECEMVDGVLVSCETIKRAMLTIETSDEVVSGEQGDKRMLTDGASLPEDGQGQRRPHVEGEGQTQPQAAQDNSTACGAEPPPVPHQASTETEGNTSATEEDSFFASIKFPPLERPRPAQPKLQGQANFSSPPPSDDQHGSSPPVPATTNADNPPEGDDHNIAVPPPSSSPEHDQEAKTPIGVGSSPPSISTEERERSQGATTAGSRKTREIQQSPEQDGKSCSTTATATSSCSSSACSPISEHEVLDPPRSTSSCTSGPAVTVTSTST
ncbi:unnamed protein product, partial [Amoebophrya sp. A25]